MPKPSDLIYPATSAMLTDIPDPTNPFWGPSSYVVGGSALSMSDIQVTELRALECTPVFACVTLIAETLGRLPLLTYRRTKPFGQEQATDHPLYNLLRCEANHDMTAQTVIETLTTHCLLWGNGYCYIARDDSGTPTELIPLLPDRTAPTRIQGELTYVSRIGASTVLLNPADVLHILGPGLNGYLGVSRIHQGKQGLGIAIAAEAYASDFYRNGIHPTGVIHHPAGVSKDAAKNVRQKIEEQHRGVTQQHRIMLLQDGVTFDPFTVDAQAAQLLESRVFSIEEAGRLFRVPSVLLNHTKDSNYAITETLMRSFVTLTLTPWASRLSNEIQRKLFREDEKTDYFAAFDFTDLLIGDTAARATYYREMLNMGAMTPDEIRQRENLPSYPGSIGTHPILNGAYQRLVDIETSQTQAPTTPSKAPMPPTPPPTDTTQLCADCTNPDNADKCDQCGKCDSCCQCDDEQADGKATTPTAPTPPTSVATAAA